MAYVGLILPYLARMFNVPTPNYVLGVKSLPSNVLAVYDSRTMTIYFRDEDPPIPVIAHEFGHHLHNIYGVELPRSELERIANLVEERLSRFYGVEPMVYGYTFSDSYDAILLVIGLAMILAGVLL